MLKINVFTQANIYTLVVILYSIRRYLLPSGLPSRIVFVLFFMLSAYYFFKVISEYISLRVIRVLTILTALFGLYGLLLVVSPPDVTWMRRCASFQFLNDFMDSLLPVFSFFYLSKKNQINEQWISVWVFVFIAVALFHYNGIMKDNLAALSEDKESSNNGGYIVMSVLPCLVFLNKRKIVQYALWAFLIMAVVFSVKRGAILLSTAALMAFLWQSIKNVKGGRKALILILSVILIIVVYFYVERLLASSNLLLHRWQVTLEGDSSGRDSMYSRYFSFFIDESGIFNLFFGYGAYGTLHYMGLMAHNDFLEIAIDMGLLGLAFYVYYWISVFGMLKRSKKICSEEVYLSLLIFTVLYFGKSLFSMSIMSISVYSAIPFGYCMAQYYNYIQRRY